MVIRVEKMRKQILIAGIVLLIIGLIMWFIGGMAAANLSNDMRMIELLGGDTSRYETSLIFWETFTVIGVFLFIIGIIVSIVGAILKEKISSLLQNPQPLIQQPVQPIVNTPVKYCPNCNTQLPINSRFCNQCGFSF
jgi:hypothetical protein